MLSRVADSLYWMARYAERAEHGARLLRVRLEAMVEQGEPLIGRLLLFEALTTQFTELRVRRDPQCPVCGDGVCTLPDETCVTCPAAWSSTCSSARRRSIIATSGFGWGASLSRSL